MDIYSSTKPLWIISRLLGLHVNEPPPAEKNVLQAKKIESIDFAAIFWHAYTAGIFIIGFCFEYAFEVNDTSVDVRKIVQFTDQLISVFNISTFCVSIAYSFFHRNTLKHLLQEFAQIEEKISYKKISLFVTFGGVLLLTLAVLSVGALFAIPSPDGFVFIKGWVLYYVFIDIADVYALQFVILVFILRQYLKVLEEKLLAKPKINEVLWVKTSSRSLYEISLKINAMFSVPLFFSVGNSFISLFSGMYFSLFGFIYGSEVFMPTKMIEFLPTVMLLLRHCVKLLALAVICENTYTIRKNIGWALHRVQTDGKKQAFGQNVTELSMQLIHEKISFNASGFFEINSNLLQMVISSVTVYLVILIQFDMAANQD